MIVVATKLDATTDRTHLEELRAFAAKRGLEFHAISSASGEGIVELVRAMANALDRIPKPAAALDASKEGEMPESSAVEVTHVDDATAAAPHTGETLTSRSRLTSLRARGIAARWRFLAARSIPFTRATSP